MSDYSDDSTSRIDQEDNVTKSYHKLTGDVKSIDSLAKDQIQTFQCDSDGKSTDLLSSNCLTEELHSIEQDDGSSTSERLDQNLGEIDEINHDSIEQDLSGDNQSENVEQNLKSSSQDLKSDTVIGESINTDQGIKFNDASVESINSRTLRPDYATKEKIDDQSINHSQGLSISQHDHIINQTIGCSEQQMSSNSEKNLNQRGRKDDNSTQDNELVDKLKTELGRLKKHLIQIEEDYTNELVEVQQREQTLEQQLIEAKAEIEQLNHRLNNTGPLVAIRQQAEQALDERDQVLQRCSKLEDEVQRSQASLANLQLVIERMQKDHDQRLQTANKLHEQNLMEERCRYSQLENEINRYQLKLKESNNALQAAARLSQQLHAKQETIDQLRIHLQKKEELVNRLHDEINNLNASCEGKMDKQFLKNLVLGYFSAASDKKQDVARLLARCLDFNEQEMRKAGMQLGSTLDHHGHRRQTSSSSTASYTTQDESFAQQFVHFLEEESKVHKATVAKQLAHDLTKVVSTPDQIKTTNLITKPVSTSSSYVTANQTANADVVGAGQQEVTKPMLIPNSAIMNAQLSKLSFNTNGNKLNQTTNITSNETIKPIVLKFATNNDRDV